MQSTGVHGYTFKRPIPLRLQPAYWIGYSFLQECEDGLSLHRLFGKGMPRRSQFLRKEDSSLYRGSFGAAEKLYGNQRPSSCRFTRVSSLLARVTSRRCEPYSAYDHHALLALSADTLVAFGSLS